MASGGVLVFLQIDWGDFAVESVPVLDAADYGISTEDGAQVEEIDWGISLEPAPQVSGGQVCLPLAQAPC